jgi:hypothetical protein
MAMTTESPPPRPPKIEISLSLIELAKSALWPVLALLAFFSFSGEIRSLLAELPYLLRRADTVTIGELKLQLTRELSAQAPAELRRALNGISGDSLARLLQLNLATGNVFCAQTHYEAEYDANKVKDTDLQQRGLISIAPYPQNNGPDMKDCYEVQVSKAGQNAEQFLAHLLTAAFHEAE